jgi:hypothetical protein
MKILRFNEEKELINEIEIDDYVVCNEIYAEPLFSEDLTQKICDFLSNNIGQYIKFRKAAFDFKYLIKYENVPYELEDAFFDDAKKNCRRMSKKEIVFWSKNKEYAEAFITSKKYNI